MGDGAAYNYIAMQQAIADSGLEDSDVSNVRTGLVVGSGGPSTSNQVEAADILREKGIKKVGTLYGDPQYVQHQYRLPSNAVQNQRRQLFNYFGLFH